MDPKAGSGRTPRSRRTLASEASSSHLSGLYGGNSAPAAPESDDAATPDGIKDKKWTIDRSRNQEMILNMYKDSKKKSDPHHSSGELGDSMESLGLHDDIHEILSPTASTDSGEKKRRSSLAKFKMHKKKDLQAPELDKAPESSRSLAGRSRGSLLERVGAADATLSDPPSSSLNKGGSSYSDRILSQHDSRKRN
jgi:hypothetical protein